MNYKHFYDFLSGLLYGKVGDAGRIAKNQRNNCFLGSTEAITIFSLMKYVSRCPLSMRFIQEFCEIFSICCIFSWGCCQINSFFSVSTELMTIFMLIKSV